MAAGKTNERTGGKSDGRKATAERAGWPGWQRPIRGVGTTFSRSVEPRPRS